MIPKNRRKLMLGLIISFGLVAMALGWFSLSYPEATDALFIVAGAGLILGWFTGRYDERRFKEDKWI